MFFRFTLPAIPVLVVSFILWFILGGIYMGAVPENFAGQDNMGIGFAVLGLCLFCVDRLAYLFLNSHSWIIILKTWMWGLVSMIAGLVIWASGLSSKNLLVFIIHWLVTMILIAVFTWFSLEHVEPKTAAEKGMSSTGEDSSD
jgi:hypothetical protein